MRALVTGGVGFIGTNLIKQLLSDGHTVTSVDNYSTGLSRNEQDGCKYYHGDVRDNFWDLSKSCQCEVGCDCNIGEFDIIFHMAALARIQPSIKNPTPAINVNLTGTLNVLEYARLNDIQVIYAGSSSKHHGLYGSPYAWSKHSGEELCKLYSEVYGLNTVICRFYNVYGEHHIREGTYATVIGIFENQFMNNEPLTIVGDGEQRRDFTHIDDIVDGLIECMGKEYRATSFELGTGVNYSINEIADIFGSRTEYIPRRPGEYDMTLCDYSKANQDLGYKPKGNLKQYITKWLGENK